MLLNNVLQQDLKTPSYYASSRTTDMQNKTSQEYEKQSKKNRSTEEVNSEEAEIHTNDPTSTNSNGSLSNGSTASTGPEIVKPIEDIGERIDAAAKALASIGQIDVISEEVNKAKTLTTTSVESIEENTTKEVKDISEEIVKSSSTNDEIYKKKETKPMWPVIVSFDTNYKRDKGGNHRMFLTYNRNSNETRFFKDDDDFIIIKNDAVENVGGFNKFCLEIEKWCEQKTNESKKQQMSCPVSKWKECEQKTDESKKYYYEDYLKAKGFIKEQEEEIDIDELIKEIDSLRNGTMKKVKLLYKII